MFTCSQNPRLDLVQTWSNEALNDLSRKPFEYKVVILIKIYVSYIGHLPSGKFLVDYVHKILNLTDFMKHTRDLWISNYTFIKLSPMEKLSIYQM